MQGNAQCTLILCRDLSWGPAWLFLACIFLFDVLLAFLFNLLFFRCWFLWLGTWARSSTSITGTSFQSWTRWFFWRFCRSLHRFCGGSLFDRLGFFNCFCHWTILPTFFWWAFWHLLLWFLFLFLLLFLFLFLKFMFFMITFFIWYCFIVIIIMRFIFCTRRFNFILNFIFFLNFRWLLLLFCNLGCLFLFLETKMGKKSKSPKLWMRWRAMDSTKDTLINKGQQEERELQPSITLSASEYLEVPDTYHENQGKLYNWNKSSSKVQEAKVKTPYWFLIRLDSF